MGSLVLLKKQNQLANQIFHLYEMLNLSLDYILLFQDIQQFETNILDQTNTSEEKYNIIRRNTLK